MHGAAHTANAPPSRTREPRPRASCRSPAPTSRSGHGSRPMKASPNTTRTNPAIALEQELVAEDPTADECRADTEEDEERREAEDERHASGDHAPRIAPLSELIRIDCRHRREVRRHEWKDARSEERDHPREERDRNRRPAHLLNRRIAPALRRRVDRRPGRAARRLASVGGARRLQTRMRSPIAMAPPARTPSGSSHARSPKPPPGGSASTSLPNWATRASLICCSLSPAAMRTLMNAFIRSATGELD